MLVREIIGIRYENRMKYIQERKGQVWRIDENASVQTAQHMSRKNLCMTV
jgi:hypothetical protein